MNITGQRGNEIFSLSPSRYNKTKIVLKIRVENDSDYKIPGMLLAEALGGKWTHRDGGYQLSPLRAKQWNALHEAGWSVHSHKQKGFPAVFIHPNGAKCELADIVFGF